MTREHDPCAMCERFTIAGRARRHHRDAGGRMIRTSPIARTGTLKPAQRYLCSECWKGLRSPGADRCDPSGNLSALLDYLSKQYEQFFYFQFGQSIALFERAPMGDQIVIPCFGSPFIATNLSMVPIIYQAVVEVNRKEKPARKSVRPNNLVPCDVITNFPKTWEQGVINFKRIFRDRQVAQIGLCRAEIIQISTKDFIQSLEHKGDFCSYHAQDRMKLIGLFLLFSSLMRFSLVPGNPDRYKDRPNRAYRLQPSRPVIAGKTIELSGQKSNNCQDGSRVQDKFGRACNLADSGCHCGIVA